MADSPSHLPRRANRTVDWKSVRAHLERLASVSDRELPPENEAVVLAARAAELARAQIDETAAPRGELHLVVRLSTERYAFAAQFATGVLTLRDCVPLPGLPAYVRGLVNVRSRIYPVVDLKAFWRLPVTPGAPEQIVLLEQEGAGYALVVDEVLEAVALDLANLQPLRAEAGLRARHLRGLLDGRLLLDLPKLFPELIVDQSRSITLSTP